MDIDSLSYSHLKFKGLSYTVIQQVRIVSATRSYGWRL